MSVGVVLLCANINTLIKKRSIVHTYRLALNTVGKCNLFADNAVHKELKVKSVDYNGRRTRGVHCSVRKAQDLSLLVRERREMKVSSKIGCPPNMTNGNW